MALVHPNLNTDLTWHLPKSSEGPHEIPAVLHDAKFLLKGFPTYLPGKMAWVGPKLVDSTFIHELGDSGRREIDSALANFKTFGLDGDLVNRENFPLPNLQGVLEGLSHELHAGKGFFVLRGIDLDNYSVEDGMTIYLGIQVYIGEQRARQDDRGNMVVHIISDSTATSSLTRSLHSRHSRASISFHTEETGDIIAWQTRSTAAKGGHCIIASAYTIYNILATTRPDIIRLLARPDWPFALPTFQLRPILYHHSSHIIINFGRAALLGSPAHPRDPTLPTITPQQLEALDVVESLARATELEIGTQKGDLHFINNLAVLHRRSGFIDREESDTAEHAGEKEQGNHAEGKPMHGKSKEMKRHLVRMRLRNRQIGWDIPAALQESWNEVFGEEGDRVWHIEPMPEAYFPLRKYHL